MKVLVTYSVIKSSESRIIVRSTDSGQDVVNLILETPTPISEDQKSTEDPLRLHVYPKYW